MRTLAVARRCDALDSLGGLRVGAGDRVELSARFAQLTARASGAPSRPPAKLDAKDIPAYELDRTQFPLVIASVFPLLDPELLEAILDRGVPIDTPLPAAMSFGMLSAFGSSKPGVLGDEAVPRGSTALDLLERMERVLTGLDATDPTPGGYLVSLRSDAREHVPLVRRVLERRGAQRSGMTAERPNVPASCAPIVEAFELLADAAAVPRSRVYEILASAQPSGPFGYFAAATKNCAELITPALAARAGDSLLYAFISGRMAAEVAALWKLSDPDADDKRYTTFLPLEGYTAESKKMLQRVGVILVGGTPKSGYWVVLRSDAGTEVHRVASAGTECLTKDVAAWLLAEARRIAA